MKLSTSGARPYILASIAALVLSMGFGAWRLADGLTTDSGNPDAGLTDAQREALHSKMRTESDTNFKAWAVEYLKTGHDYRSMPRADTLGDFVAPLPDLATATRQAALIISGTVSHTSFRYDDGMKGVMADVTVNVDQLLKGDAPDGTVRLTQDGGPTINFGNGVVYLKQDDIDPILLDGDRVVLFLQPSNVEGWEPWSSQGWTGQYLVDDGNRLHATEDNAFGREVNGVSVDSFLARVKGLVAAE